MKGNQGEELIADTLDFFWIVGEMDWIFGAVVFCTGWIFIVKLCDEFWFGNGAGCPVGTGGGPTTAGTGGGPKTAGGGGAFVLGPLVFPMEIVPVEPGEVLLQGVNVDTVGSVPVERVLLLGGGAGRVAI